MEKKNTKIWKKGTNLYFGYNVKINAQYGRLQPLIFLEKYDVKCKNCRDQN